MKSGHSRRRVLQGLAGAPLVLGWDPRARSGVTEAAACDFSRLPPLDGTLHVDPATRAAFADDFGHLLSREPCAVLAPGSIRDLDDMVTLARRQGLKLAMNGQSGTPDRRESHSSFGQAQVAGGVAVDARPFAEIDDITPEGASVEAGVLWSELFDAAAPLGLTPPVLTDYMHLSIGGTLSMGGIGGATSRFGTQADNVISLRVLTGEGQRATCSRRRSPELFEAVLAGQGQCGIICGPRSA